MSPTSSDDGIKIEPKPTALSGANIPKGTVQTGYIRYGNAIYFLHKLMLSRARVTKRIMLSPTRA
jgi:hypothetical protein